MYLKKITKIPNDDLHVKFKLLRDEPTYYGAKKIIEDWTNNFFDKDNKIIKEFQTTFHSSFWEFYLHSVFEKIGFKLNTENNRPDFIISSPEEIYIEAVVSEIKDAGRSENERIQDDIFNNLLPISTKKEFSELIDEAIVRHSNSINSKLKKYTGFNVKNKWKSGYVDCKWVNKDRPYLIALASFDQISYGKEYIYSMEALLYGMYYNPETKTYIKRGSIKKPGTNSDIEIGIFNNPLMQDVSAVIFSNTLTLGKLSSLSKSNGTPSFQSIINVRYSYDPPHYRIHEVEHDNPEYLLDGLYIFHNPNAKNKLSEDLLSSSGLLQFTIDSYEIAMQGLHMPIVSRFCTPLKPLVEQFKAVAASEYNGVCAYEFKKNKT